MILALLLACGGAEDLLAAREPVLVHEVEKAERITDGRAVASGTSWDTPQAAWLRGEASQVVWDFGAPTHLEAAWLQGDNNDDFLLEGSLDQHTWSTIWRSGTTRRQGMRDRHTRDIDAEARWLRLRAEGGDARVSLSELMVYGDVPDPWPPRVWRGLPLVSDAPGIPALLVAGALAVALALGHRRQWPRWVLGLLVALVVAAATWAGTGLGWPPQNDHENLVRALAALLAMAVVTRLVFFARQAHQGLLAGLLSAAAVLAVGSFYNLGHPQFRDFRDQGATWVHYYDLRVYHPTALYFDELGYDQLYWASARAWLEESRRPREAVADQRIRDLETNSVVRLADCWDRIDASRRRFSDARWQAFRRDMAFFQATMGPRYAESMVDHGANGTPVWLLALWALYRWAPASDGILLLGALLDPLLLLGFALLAWRAFGSRTALVSLVVFGTSTLPYLGTNWAGATLRHDWMLMLGLGACAFQLGRPAVGGALLGWAAMVRGFPAFAVAFLVVPSLWARVDRRDPRSHLRLAGRALAGTAVAATVLFGASSAVFGVRDGWGAWADKIAIHAESHATNHVSLASVVGYDPSTTGRALYDKKLDDPWDPWFAAHEANRARRRPLALLVSTVLTGLALLAARGAPLHRAALLGMMLVPVWMDPSNYYLHYVFLLPLLVPESRPRLWGGVALLLVGLSVFEYASWFGMWVDERFTWLSAGVLVSFATLLAVLAREGLRRRG